MKIVAISGSPRKNGNTEKVLGFLEERVGQQHEFEKIRIASHRVNGCLGCGACKEDLNEPGCIQKDDGVSILQRMRFSDFVIYASPLYCWGFSSQIKALIDRHFCMIKGYGTPDYKSLLEGKKTSLLVTCDGPMENNADLIQGVFERVCDYAKCGVVGKYIVPFCLHSGSVETNGMSIADKMAADILDY